MTNLSNNHKIKSVTDHGQNLSMILTYIGDEMYEAYENIFTVEKPTFTEVNEAFEANFAPISNPAYECCFFRKLKQRHDETIHQFYISLEKQSQKYVFTDLNRDIK